MTISEQRTTPSGAQVDSSGEITTLTGLRIVAASWVVLFHFHFTALAGVTLAVSVLGPLLTAGALGVDLFFVLSGFVIAHTYLTRLGPAFRPREAATFLWARICRMWPVYVLVFHLFGLWLLARLLIGSDGDIAFQGVQPVMSPVEWLQQLFMVQMWDEPYLDGASWVGPTWSISAEWLAYLLFPVTALLFFRLRNLPVAALVTAALLVMGPLAAAYVVLGHPYYPGSWAVRILCAFSAGVLTHLVVRKLPRTEAVRTAASWLAVAVPVLVAVGLLAGELAGPGRGGVVIVLFPVLVGALALADRGPAMLLTRPAMQRGGRASYSLYLVHIPMFEIFWLVQAYAPELGPNTLMGHVVGLAVVLGTYPVATRLHAIVEEPARRWLRALARRPSTPAEAGRGRHAMPPRSAMAAAPAPAGVVVADVELLTHRVTVEPPVLRLDEPATPRTTPVPIILGAAAGVVLSAGERAARRRKELAGARADTGPLPGVSPIPAVSHPLPDVGASDAEWVPTAPEQEPTITIPVLAASLLTGSGELSPAGPDAPAPAPHVPAPSRPVVPSPSTPLEPAPSRELEPVGAGRARHRHSAQASQPDLAAALIAAQCRAASKPSPRPRPRPTSRRHRPPAEPTGSSAERMVSG